MHSPQRSLESALKSDVRIKTLLNAWTLKLPSGRRDPGNFSRALKNSHKLAAKFRKAQTEALTHVSELLATNHAPGFAAQRFDTLLLTFRMVVTNLEATSTFLMELAALKDDQCSWARGLLEVPGLHVWIGSDIRHT